LQKHVERTQGGGLELHPTRLARGETVTHGPCDCFLYDRMAQRPPVLVNLIFVLLGVVESNSPPLREGARIHQISEDQAKPQCIYGPVALWAHAFDEFRGDSIQLPLSLGLIKVLREPEKKCFWNIITANSVLVSKFPSNGAK
jgi:hypothetical protein